MPVSAISCTLDRKTAQLATVKGSEGVGGKYTLGYDVVMASVAGPVDVFNNAQGSSPHALPSPWATYSYAGSTDAYSYAKSYTITRDLQVATRYYVTVSYAPAEPGEVPEGSSTPINAEPNPILRDPVIWWDREVTTRNELTNHLGYAVVTSANSFHQDIIQKDRTKSLAVVKFNVASQAAFAELSRKYDQSVNVGPWTFKGSSMPARNVAIRDMSIGPLIQEGAYQYYVVSMRLAFTDTGKTWDVALPEMGRFYYTKTGGNYDLDQLGFRKRTDAGTLVPLNPDGTRRDDSQPILVSNHQVDKQADFGQLPFSAAVA